VFRVVDTETDVTVAEYAADHAGWVPLWFDFDGDRGLVGLRDELVGEGPATRVVLFDGALATDLDATGRATFVFSVPPPDTGRRPVGG
jgi:hypothetical protein